MNNRLFVGGLGFNVDKDEVIQHFSRYGTVLQFVLCEDHDGESRGFGFVTFGKEVEAFKCLNEVSHRIKDRILTVTPSTIVVQPTTLKTKRAFISFLGVPDVTENSIRELVGGFGNIQSLNFTSAKKGYCTVVLSTEEEVDHLMSKRHVLNGKVLYVRKAIQREEVKRATQSEREREAQESRLRSSYSGYVMQQTLPEGQRFFSAAPSLLDPSPSQTVMVMPQVAPPPQVYAQHSYPPPNAISAMNNYGYSTNKPPKAADGSQPDLSNYGYSSNRTDIGPGAGPHLGNRNRYGYI